MLFLRDSDSELDAWLVAEKASVQEDEVLCKFSRFELRATRLNETHVVSVAYPDWAVPGDSACDTQWRMEGARGRRIRPLIG